MPTRVLFEGEVGRGPPRRRLQSRHGASPVFAPAGFFCAKSSPNATADGLPAVPGDGSGQTGDSTLEGNEELVYYSDHATLDQKRHHWQFTKRMIVTVDTISGRTGRRTRTTYVR